ncbi:protein adenylyltransferase SelO family protein [Rhodoferax sp.]|uniref:protein adenylyltransferase SelO n=1 Tax=Rhodoferax sp. TaxID=50421 RepID=UPI00284A28EF|nr:YdiU family protein [Rhodoferax sp.]MDR3368363.1 YdiU family protein [Rhodoferax sp.]
MNAPLTPIPLVKTPLTWNNRFHRLGPGFYTSMAPQPLPAPYWVGRSQSAAELLGLDASWMDSPDLLQALSGNLPISGTQPLASVYSGHQFGSWAGQLGDGRAILLGEAQGWEIQLKGSGLTPYSRMGDGRAVLRSSIREFLCSEAMHALGIPTTRALCVTGSDEPIARETLETAAVVTRLAPSFIRFGHFEHFASRGQQAELKTLADFVIDNFYPDCRETVQFDGNAYAHLLQQVSERTAVMLAHWQAVGFCHGVMNTDNMSILGLTMDYGPFAFMDAFDPGHICNHTDRSGRYAFDQQPEIAHWNLFALAHALLPLIGRPALAEQALEAFQPRFTQTYQHLMLTKLGLTLPPTSSDDATAPGAADSVFTDFIRDTLALLTQDRVDYSIFWRRLSHARASARYEPVRDLFISRPDFDTWLLRYSELVAQSDQGLEANLMLNVNPKFVLRNYLGEQAIESARQKDFTAVAHLLAVLQHPYDEHPAFETLAGFPPEWASHIEISCSS